MFPVDPLESMLGPTIVFPKVGGHVEGGPCIDQTVVIIVCNDIFVNEYWDNGSWWWAGGRERSPLQMSIV